MSEESAKRLIRLYIRRIHPEILEDGVSADARSGEQRNCGREGELHRRRTQDEGSRRLDSASAQSGFYSLWRAIAGHLLLPVSWYRIFTDKKSDWDCTVTEGASLCGQTIFEGVDRRGEPHGEAERKSWMISVKPKVGLPAPTRQFNVVG